MGKTSLVLNIAQHVGTKTDMTVGFFSLEMSKEQLFLRMLTVRGAHRRAPAAQRLPRRAATTAGCRRRSARSARRKIFIDDTPSIGVLEMRAKARRLKAEHGLDLLIVDYIQLMQGRGRFENRSRSSRRSRAR